MLNHPIQKLITCIFFVNILACGGGSANIIPPQAAPGDPQPTIFLCNPDITCPEIVVSGNEYSTDAFRGYGDPSLEFDASTNTLWMSYSWLNVVISDPGSPAVFDLAVRTHLAKSIDNGNSFSFVREINQPEQETHPDSAEQGLTIHEVSTLVKQADNEWQVLWLKYFTPLGTTPGVEDRTDFLLWRSTSNTAENLADNSEVWARTFVASDAWNAPINLNNISELSDCAVLTEPALFNHNNQIYLAASCLIVDLFGRHTDRERLVLLRQISSGYEFVGNIFDALDAASLGADVLEQADISVAKDGSVIIIVTPIVLGGDPSHQGCVVFEFDDFSNAQVKRNANGKSLARNIITADSSREGGLCSYDAASETGIIMVLTNVTQNGTDVEFSMRATGVHP